jgi:hypothetical protein
MLLKVASQIINFFRGERKQILRGEIYFVIKKITFSMCKFFHPKPHQMPIS